MLKEILKKFNVEIPEEATDEEVEQILEDHLNEKNTQIQNLESEKDALSKEKEELSASVEGHKSTEENLTKELSDTKTELATTKGKLEQVTEMYKEQFTKDPNEPKEDVVSKIDTFDIIEALANAQ